MSRSRTEKEEKTHIRVLTSCNGNRELGPLPAKRHPSTFGLLVKGHPSSTPLNVVRGGRLIDHDTVNSKKLKVTRENMPSHERPWDPLHHRIAPSGSALFLSCPNREQGHCEEGGKGQDEPSQF